MALSHRSGKFRRLFSSISGRLSLPGFVGLVGPALGFIFLIRPIMLCPCLEFADVEEALLWCRDGITCYCIVTAMDKTEAESRVLQSDASGDARAVSAPVQTRDSARQLELDFRAPVLQMDLPDHS